MDYFLFNFSGVQFHYTMSLFTIVFNSLWINCSFNCIMLPDIDSTFFHVLCGNLIVSKGSLYVYLFELDLRNLLYVIFRIVVSGFIKGWINRPPLLQAIKKKGITKSYNL